MPVGRHVQTSLASGEFDPLMWSREDVSFFYNSARIIENVVPLPQAGGKRREGWRHIGLQRGPISSVSVSGATLTAPNGGTTANANDGDDSTLFTTTTNIGTSTSYVVIKIDFGSATRISLMDFDGLRLTSGEAAFALEYSSDDAAWTEAHRFNVGTTAYDRRFGQAPNVDLGTYRYWRLVMLNPTGADYGAAFAEFNEFKAWTEAGYSQSGTPGLFSMHRLTASIVKEYTIVITAGCGDVYRDGVWKACIALPYTDAAAGALKNTARLDTLVLYNQDFAPRVIQVLSEDSDWRSDPFEFESVVEFPFDDDNVSGGVNEKQYIEFDSMAASDILVLEFFGEVSGNITWTANEVTNAAAIKSAIEGLDDFDLVTVTNSGTGVNANFTVFFQGNKAKQSVPIMVVDILTGSGTAVVSRTRYGKPDTDDLWSSTRGYPRCGAFYQGRHWMGGFKARDDVYIASRAGNLFDFKEDADPVVGSPIVVAPGVDDQVSVLNIYPGRHLQIFTSSAEMYIPDEPITVDNIAAKITSRHGASGDVQPVDIQGGTLFVDRNGNALREYLFTDAEQSYSAEPVSLLAGHLLNSPRSLVLRRSREVDEPSFLCIANTGQDSAGNDIPAALCVINRAQQVTGFCRIKTPGTPLEFSTTQAGDAYVMVKRDLAGVEWNYLEQFDEDYLSDASVKVSGSGSTISLSAYPWLEGQTVYVHGDGLPLGEFTVSSNSVDLGDASFSSEAEVGLFMVPRLVLHPYKGKGEVSPTMQRQRIFRALLQLERTGAIAITAHDGGRVRKVPLRNWDAGVFDQTAEEALYSGPKRVTGLGAWQIEPTIEITQLEPMPFLIRSITFDVRY